MLHYGKNPQEELEIRATAKDIGVLYRSLCNASLPDRGSVYALRTYIEENFSEDELSTNY
jgi:adenylate cyclase